MTKVPGFTLAVAITAAAAAFFAAPLFTASTVSRAGSLARPAAAEPASLVVPATLAGVAYNPAEPLKTAETPLFDAKNPPPMARTYSVRFAGGVGEAVPGLLTLPGAKTSAPSPCILLLHGLGGRKEDLMILQTALARRGYASLAVDAAGHGQRPGIDGKKVADLSLEQMRRLVGQTVIDLRRAVDYLGTRSEIDSSRVGYVGVSLGGIIGGTFAGAEPRVKGTVLWAAGGDWGKLITTSQHDFAKKYRAKGETDAAKIEAILADVDPVRYIGQAAPRPLLFLNGTQDNVVPRACTDELYAAAGQPKRIQFIPGGHVPDPSTLVRETLDWLDANIKK